MGPPPPPGAPPERSPPGPPSPGFPGGSRSPGHRAEDPAVQRPAASADRGGDSHAPPVDRGRDRRAAVRRQEGTVAMRRKTSGPAGSELDRLYKELQIHQAE